MAVGPSGGALQRLFNPANMKKRMKSAMGVAPPGGHGLQATEGPTFKKRLVQEKPKLLMARNAGRVLGPGPKQPKQVY